MSRKLAGFAVAIAAVALAACGSRYGSTAGASGNTYLLPGMPDLQIKATLPNGETGNFGEELPGEGLGSIDDSFWGATLGGFTQEKFSQALGFPKGTKITLTNLSSDISHTLNVVAEIKGPPANFPSNPSLPAGPLGNGKLKKGYASGILSPGSSVKLTLAKNGIYLIGCHFHYNEGMRDVLVVAANATPGPQATPPGR
jgi:plastocyanin